MKKMAAILLSMTLILGGCGKGGKDAATEVRSCFAADVSIIRDHFFWKGIPSVKIRSVLSSGGDGGLQAGPFYRPVYLRPDLLLQSGS